MAVGSHLLGSTVLLTLLALGEKVGFLYLVSGAFFISNQSLLNKGFFIHMKRIENVDDNRNFKLVKII